MARTQSYGHNGTGMITKKIEHAQWYRHDSTVTMGTRIIAPALWHGHNHGHNGTITIARVQARAQSRAQWHDNDGTGTGCFKILHAHTLTLEQHCDT